jgi:hypothetical protein
VSDTLLDINDYTQQGLAAALFAVQNAPQQTDSQFRKTYKIMQYTWEIFQIGLLFSKLNVMLKKTGAGYAAASIREYEWIIANFGNFKRELNNLGNPIQYSDLEHYMRYKCHYFCYKYRSLLDKCHEYFSCNGVLNQVQIF